jgi:DNA polymerase-3 subunit epsilon
LNEQSPTPPASEAPTIPAERRTLLSIDVETTGLVPWKDHIVQIAIITLYANDDFHEWSSLVNPGVHIPSNVVKIHGIDDEIVRAAPSFMKISGPIISCFNDVDIYGYDSVDVCGYNVPFDLAFLRAEFDRISMPMPRYNSIYDPCAIFKRRERRDLCTAVKMYLGEEHVGAHGAVADARAALRVLRAQEQRYGLEWREL